MRDKITELHSYNFSGHASWMRSSEEGKAGTQGEDHQQPNQPAEWKQKWDEQICQG